ncbi:sensor histidine kinase [Nakamurella sp. A5-74]|uniref:Sensor histidine kinase n=1 Tax=Nakamurella sp. A5-74 TaxID=3158264 RepID=A0AAU8DTL5_9ACTN
MQNVMLRRWGWRWEPGSTKWVLGSSVALLYAGVFLVGLLTQPAQAGARWTAVVLLVAMMAGYAVLPAGAMSAPLRTRWAVLIVILTLAAAQIVVVGPGFVGVLMFPGILAGALLPTRQTIITVVAIGAAMVLIAGSDSWELAATEVAMALWMHAFFSNIRLTIQLRAAQDELAVAAVAQERRRIARDLHDILGHSLTAISVKAALAERLSSIDPVRAAQESNEVGQIARGALADVRATASGMREASLAGELAVARSILAAAGIAADLPRAVDEVTEQGHRLFGFVVREAVTNVVRHSGASRCSVTLGSRWVEIVDDGKGFVQGRSPESGSSGLAGLSERVAAQGGRLTVGSAAPQGFSVRAELAPV